MVHELIDQDQSITKVTSCVKLCDIDFESALKFMSAPTKQTEQVECLVKTKTINRMVIRESKTIERIMMNVPFGFAIQHLEISMSLHQEEWLLIFSQCLNIETLQMCQEEEESDEKDVTRPNYPELLAIPRLVHLKKLWLSVSYDSDDLGLAYMVLELTPNLEYFHFQDYHSYFEDDFLEFIAKMCPKLKGINCSLELDAESNTVTDEGILKFLQSEPHLEYIDLFACYGVSGEIFSKIGQFKNLKYFSIARDGYREPCEVDDQCDNLTFGGGVLKKLEYCNIGYDLTSFAEDKEGARQFIDSLIKMAPNLKDIGWCLSIEGIDLMDAVEKLIPILTSFPLRFDQATDPEIVKLAQTWLERSTILEEVDLTDLQHVKNFDFSNIKPIPSVKRLVLSPTDDLPWNELCRIFPSVVEIHSTSLGQAFMELIKQGAWPNLKPSRALVKRNCEQVCAKYGLEDKEFLYDWFVRDLYDGSFFTNVSCPHLFGEE